MIGFIDPPSPFDPLAAWTAFVAELVGIVDKTPEVEQALLAAEETVRQKTADGERPEDFADLEG